MAITEEELQAKRERNEKLREQIVAEQAKRYEVQADLANEVTAAELDAEGARLQAELAGVQRDNDTLADGASAPLQSARERMDQAAAMQQAAEDAAAQKATADAEQGVPQTETPVASAVSPTPTTGAPETLTEPEVTTTSTNTKGK